MKTKRVARRKHSDQPKAELLQACHQADASMGAIALQNGFKPLWFTAAAQEFPEHWTSRWQAYGEQGPARRRVHCRIDARADSAGFARNPRGGAPHRSSYCHGELAGSICQRVRGLVARVAAVIHIDVLWLATSVVDMRFGSKRLLARVVQVFGADQAHYGYLFANVRSTRIKLLVHDGFGAWCASRRLNQGRFAWPRELPETAASMTLTQPQFDALVLSLRWQRLKQMQVITRM